MVIRKNNINQIRFDVLNKPLYLGKLKNYKQLLETIGWAEGTHQHVLILRLRIYSLDIDTNEELIGYTVEVTNAITQTTIEQDRASLISYIDWLLTGANAFLTMKVPIFRTLEFDQFDTAEKAEEILDALKGLGWYA
jgi:hypothetical protein